MEEARAATKFVLAANEEKKAELVGRFPQK
jgi:hypothetical protein